MRQNLLFQIVIYVRKTDMYLEFLTRIECFMRFCKNEDQLFQ